MFLVSVLLDVCVLQIDSLIQSMARGGARGRKKVPLGMAKRSRPSSRLRESSGHVLHVPLTADLMGTFPAIVEQRPVRC